MEFPIFKKKKKFKRKVEAEHIQAVTFNVYLVCKNLFCFP